MGKTNLHDRVLGEMGLTEYKEKNKPRKLKPKVETTTTISKTPMMRYIELVEGRPIEDMLLEGSLSVTANKFGVDPSTVSKWIKRFKLRYTKDNLPQCDGCTRHRPSCDGGVCTILMDLELYDLMMVKREEILNG